MTQTKLSELVGVSVRTINDHETGRAKGNPSEETLKSISQALGFPVSFFEQPPADTLSASAASFRALTKASASLRLSAIASGTIAMEMHRVLSDKFNLPTPDLSDMRDVSPERAADKIRHEWGIGQRPIGNVIHLLELHGVRVFSLSEDCDSIDAFSLWRNGVPFVFLNSRKTAERSIFDTAHELGHLLLHRHGEPTGRKAEIEADNFAANFLLPEQAIRAAAPRLATIGTIALMKRTWRASVAAIGFRLHELGLMTDWHYRQFNIELSHRGRKNEPEPLPRETSAILRKIFDMLSENGRGIRDIASELHVPMAEIRALTFGLRAIEGEGDRGPDRIRVLRLVQ